MTQDVAVSKQDALPANFTELSSMAKAFVSSGMFQDTKQLSQAIVKIQAGRELGLSPVYAMQNINMIRNRLTCSANTMAMLVKKSGKYNYRIKEHQDKSCTITFYEREGEKWVEVGDSTFTMEDAKRADLLKPDSGWVKYPRAMLFSRAISQGARLYCPDAIGGVYTDEEIRSIPPRPEEHNNVVIEKPAPQPAEINQEGPEDTPPELTQNHTETKGKTVVDEIDYSPIANSGELFSRCRNYGISRTQALEVVPNPQNYDLAWEKIAETLLKPILVVE